MLLIPAVRVTKCETVTEVRDLVCGPCNIPSTATNPISRVGLVTLFHLTRPWSFALHQVTPHAVQVLYQHQSVRRLVSSRHAQSVGRKNRLDTLLYATHANARSVLDPCEIPSNLATFNASCSRQSPSATSPHPPCPGESLSKLSAVRRSRLVIAQHSDGPFLFSSKTLSCTSRLRLAAMTRW